MQLNIGGPPDDPQILAPPEWTMEVLKQGHMYTAEVKRSMLTMCRLSIATGADEAGARTALARKARLWIHAYLEQSQPE
jgi:hypothetical protein